MIQVFSGKFLIGTSREYSKLPGVEFSKI